MEVAQRRLDIFRPYSVLFLPASCELMVASEGGLFRIGLEWKAGRLNIGERQSIQTPDELFALYLSQDSDGTTFFAELAGHARHFAAYWQSHALA